MAQCSFLLLPPFVARSSVSETDGVKGRGRVFLFHAFPCCFSWCGLEFSNRVWEIYLDAKVVEAATQAHKDSRTWKSVSQRIEVKLKTFRTLLLYSRIPDNGEEFSIPKNNILYILISCLSICQKWCQTWCHIVFLDSLSSSWWVEDCAHGLSTVDVSKGAERFDGGAPSGNALRNWKHLKRYCRKSLRCWDDWILFQKIAAPHSQK